MICPPCDFCWTWIILDLWEQLTSSTWQVDAKAVFGPGYDPLQVVKDIFNEQIDSICQLPHWNKIKSWVVRPPFREGNGTMFFWYHLEIAFGLRQGPEMDQPPCQQTWAWNSTCHLRHPAATGLTGFPKASHSWSLQTEDALRWTFPKEHARAQKVSNEKLGAEQNMAAKVVRFIWGTYGAPWGS